MAETRLEIKGNVVWSMMTDHAKREFIDQIRTVPARDLRQIQAGLSASTRPQLPLPAENTERRVLENLIISDILVKRAPIDDRSPVVGVSIIGTSMTLRHQTGSSVTINLGPKNTAPAVLPAAKIPPLVSAPAAQPQKSDSPSVDNLSGKPGALFLNDDAIDQIVKTINPPKKDEKP